MSNVQKFVTRSFEYQVHLGLETKLHYDALVVSFMEAGTEASMRRYGLGAVSNSAG